MRTPASIDAARGDTIDLDAVDLVDLRMCFEGYPHPVWAQMRRQDPVRWHPVGSDLGFWSVTNFEHGSWVLRDHETFTSQRGPAQPAGQG